MGTAASLGLFLNCGTGQCRESSSETRRAGWVLRAAPVHPPAGEWGMETAALQVMGAPRAQVLPSFRAHPESFSPQAKHEGGPGFAGRLGSASPHDCG